MSINDYVVAIQREAATGAATEHTFRPALKALFESLDAGISAINEPKRIDCGAPDFQVMRGALPVGHVEAKDLGADLDRVQRSEQLARYLPALPNLILTNSLEFRWFVGGELRATAQIGRRDRGGKVVREPAGELDLQHLLAGFVAQQPPVLATPRELALKLASMARLTRDMIAETFKREGQRGDLHDQFDAFRRALIPGLDTAEFADMYAQTLAYGLFAARLSQPASAAGFSRQSASGLLPKTNPFLRRLFYEIAGPDLDDRIAWAVDDIATLLARADMAEVLRDFGRRTRQHDPVVHFYETFLAAYDPKMRESRGVYYTPEPVVSFIVRSVDHVLRTRFGKPLGLADQDTLILDPATGTATFLYFVVEQIYETLRSNGLDGGWESYVGEGPKSLLRRLFGFELLMAPYTVAHLKLGLQLQEKGYRFSSNERLGVYLTNTLDEGVPTQQAMPFARYIAEESEAAAEVKSSKPIMVVLGNPPYSGHSENKSPWIVDLVDDYKRGFPELHKPAQGKWLQNDYVKFIRFGQWKINNTGEGILAFISDNSYLGNPTFRGMRKSLMASFDDIYILNLHGNSKKKEKTPGDGVDENVFDIQQGVSITLFVKYKSSVKSQATIKYADIWGLREYKYETLFKYTINTINWNELRPYAPNYLFLPKDENLKGEYDNNISLDNIMNRNGDPAPGIVTTQDQFAISWNYDESIDKIAKFLATSTEEEARTIWKLCSQNQWNYNKAKNDLSKDEDWKNRIIPIQYRPFDTRSVAFDPNVAVHLRKRVMDHMIYSNNIAISTAKSIEISQWEHVFCSDLIIQHHTVSNKEVNYLFPLYLYPIAKKKQATLFDGESDEGAGPDGRRANLSKAFITDVTGRLGLGWVADGRGDLASSIGPEDVFHYAYAVFHSPTYRSRYAELLKIDFPRLPLTSDLGLFRDLAGLGAELVDLHLLRLPGAAAAGAVGGNGGHAALASPRTRFGGSGANTVEKVSYDAAAQRVHISKGRYFEGVDADTWAFRIGGYQVLDKWLKDRKGRTLSFEDLLHYQRVVVALAETRRIMAAIDARIGGWPLA